MMVQAQLHCLYLLMFYLVREEDVLYLFTKIFFTILLPQTKEAMVIT